MTRQTAQVNVSAGFVALPSAALQGPAQPIWQQQLMNWAYKEAVRLVALRRQAYLWN